MLTVTRTTATALLTASLAIASIAAPTAASAASRSATTAASTPAAASTKSIAGTTTTSAAVKAPARTTTTLQAGPHASTAIAVTATPTGDGPANADDCDSFALRINFVLMDLQDSIDAGDEQGVSDNIDAANNWENMALDGGCILVY
jgi:hypothetical protein